MRSGSVRQEARDGCSELARRRRLLDDGHVGPHAPHEIVAAVEEERDAPFFENPTEFCAVRIANLVVTTAAQRLASAASLQAAGSCSAVRMFAPVDLRDS